MRPVLTDQPLRRVQGITQHWRQALTLWQRNLVTRRALRTLEPQALEDIGLDAQSADEEGRKAFWQV